MKAYLMIWNPKRFDKNEMVNFISNYNKSGKDEFAWSTINKKIKPGDQIFLCKLGKPPKGIIGSGMVISEVYPGKHWTDSQGNANKTVFYVDIKFDYISEKPLITEDELNEEEFKDQLWFPQGSGIIIKNEVLEELNNLWNEKLNKI